MALTYSEKLKNPKWQRKRLEIFQRDNWACVNCESTTECLRVHHKKYIYGNDPWDYDNSFLETLCHKCHEKEHEITPEPIATILTKIEYENLYKEELPVLAIIKQQIHELQEKLKNITDDLLEAEILKNIIFLQGKRKELTNG